MTTAIIGLESMPNVYFNSVGISDNKLQILLSMKDSTIVPTWHTSQILKDILKIKLIAISYNTGPPGAVPPIDLEMKEFADSLKSGESSIHDFDNSSQIIEIAAQSYNQDRTFVTSDGIANLYYNLEFTSNQVNLDKNNIFVFAIAYIDVTTMNLNYASYKYLDGPMVSETVRQNNQVPQNATLFRLDDGSIWSGPVHQHEDGYMEGSFHKQEPHSDLSAELVEAKVTQFIEDVLSEAEDARPPDFDPNIDSSTLEPPTTFPQLEESYYFDNSGESSFFCLDTANLALSELQSAREIYNTNNEYFYKLMKDFLVNQLEIRKAPLKNRLDFTDIGSRDWSYDYTKETVLAKTIMTDGMFEERYEMRFFSQQYNVNPARS